jgi:hypothetical protein
MPGAVAAIGDSEVWMCEWPVRVQADAARFVWMEAVMVWFLGICVIGFVVLASIREARIRDLRDELSAWKKDYQSNVDALSSQFKEAFELREQIRQLKDAAKDREDKISGLITMQNEIRDIVCIEDEEDAISCTVKVSK